MDKYRVSLTSEERAELEHLVTVGKAAARKLTHARILLLADTAPGPGDSDDALVAALGTGPRTIARVRQRFVTQGFHASLDPKPQPPRPDKIKIKGDLEQKLVHLACSDPPQGRCHWTLQLLADELVVLGLVESISTETVRQALKKTTSNRGSSRPGVFHPKPMRSTCGGWRTCFRCTRDLTTPGIPWSASMRRANNCSAKSGPRSVPAGAELPGRITNTSGRGSAIS